MLYFCSIMKPSLILLSFLPFCVLAQEKDEVEFTADRPGTTTSVDVLPKGRVQWETGVGYERARADDIVNTAWTLNETLLRWGFSDFAELRFQGAYLYDIDNGEAAHGFSNIAIGTKAKLFNGWKAVPTISLLANVFIPGSTDATFMIDEWGGQMGLLFNNNLSPWCTLSYEADLIWYASAKPTLLWGLCLDFQVTKRCSLMLEEFNFHYPQLHEHWVELGASYMLVPRLKLDLSTDINLRHPKTFFNLMLGVAWQITKK